MQITMTMNPKTNPLYLKPEIRDFLIPHMLNNDIPLHFKILGILFAVSKYATYTDKECEVLQTVPGRNRSIDDVIRILYGLGYTPPLYEIFNTIYEYSKSLFGIGYCGTIKRHTIWWCSNNIFIKCQYAGGRKYYRNVDKYDELSDILVPENERRFHYVLTILKYKLFIGMLKLKNTYEFDIPTPYNIQEGYIPVTEWNTINKNTVFNFDNKEQFR